METSEEFRSLAAMLLPSHQPELREPAVEIIEEPIAIEETDLVRNVRLFHARLAEALDAAVERLLCDVACEVLARELQIEPADVERIVDRALQRYAGEEPLRVRLHPDDAASACCEVPVVADAQLSRGDAVVELRDGFVDATLGVRVEAVLRGIAS